MRIASLEAPTRIDYDLTFLKPWKSKSTVAFVLSAAGSNTRVTWRMKGALPVFLFFYFSSQQFQRCPYIHTRL